MLHTETANDAHDGPVAQSVEQRIENPCVGGSIPPRATKKFIQKAQSKDWAFCCLEQSSNSSFFNFLLWVPPLFKDLNDDDFDGYSLVADQLLDVPFVPSDEAIVEIMLDMGQVSAKDILYDLGSGDGRILITAAKERNTQGVGIEIDPDRIAEAMEDAAYSEVEFLIDFVEESIYTADFSEATVVTLYLLHSVNLDLRPRILNELRPGTRIVSHSFDMGDWKPDEKRELGGICIFKWIVPAQVAGFWIWQGVDEEWYSVELAQEFQEVSGTAWRDETPIALISATLCGERLELCLQASETAPLQYFTLYFENNEVQSIEQYI